MQAEGEMDVATQATPAGGDTGDRAEVQIEAGLFLDALEGTKAVEEMQVHCAPHPLHRPQGTGGLNLHGDEGVTESLLPEAWGVPPEGDR